jgi:hypothetical protein
MFPLRIFKHPNANRFTNLADKTAEYIVNNGQLEAFRIAARRFVKEWPHSLPYLLLTLVLAERLNAVVMADRFSLWMHNGGVDAVAPTPTF